MTLTPWPNVWKRYLEWNREPIYNALFGAEKEDIGPENTYLWNVKA
jgi:hypothetical protein